MAVPWRPRCTGADSSSKEAGQNGFYLTKRPPSPFGASLAGKAHWKSYHRRAGLEPLIVSHQHRYLFVEIPHTASWAIHHELRTHYGGQPILHKHATYREFRRYLGKEAGRYFAFATVRNPLDSLVSRYVKLKTNHKQAFTDPDAAARLLIDQADRLKYQAIREADAEFEWAFRRYWSLPYSGMIDLSAQDLDFTIRYESLQEGFSQALKLLGLRQVRAVPVRNKTEGKMHWESYYTSEIIPLAMRACGPFMAKWNYAFPPSWGPYKPSRYDRFRFQLISAFRDVYLQRVRYAPGMLAKAIRGLRAALYH